VCRGLVRAEFPAEKVRGTLLVLRDMADSGFLEVNPVSGVRIDSEEMVIDLHLYVIDAITLATSFSKRLDLVTEDKHLQKEAVKRLAAKIGVNVLGLAEMEKLGL